MMAYVSNMTNGHHNFIFKQEVLTQQCSWEAERPVKPILRKLFEGKVSKYYLYSYYTPVQVTLEIMFSRTEINLITLVTQY